MPLNNNVNHAGPTQRNTPETLWPANVQHSWSSSHLLFRTDLQRNRLAAVFAESWLCCRCDCDAKRAEQKKSYQAEQPDAGACRQPDKRGKPWTQCYQQNKNNRSCWHTGGETHRASVRRRKRSIWWTWTGAMFTLLTTSPCRDDGERESRRTVSYQLRNVVCNLCECVWMLRVELCAKTAVSKATFQLSCCNNSSGPDGHNDSPRLWLSVK